MIIKHKINKKCGGKKYACTGIESKILYLKMRRVKHYYATEYNSFRCNLKGIHSLINIHWGAIFYLCNFLSPLPSALQLEIDLTELGFHDTSTFVGHFVSSPREREKRDRTDSRRDERDEQGRKSNRNESEETEEIKTFSLYPYLLQG